MKISKTVSLLFLWKGPEMTSDGMAPIYMRITVTGFPRKETSLGIKILQSDWDKNASRVLSTCPNAIRFNKIISKTKTKIETLETLLSARYEYITAEMLMLEYQNSITPPKKEKERTLCQVLNYKYSIFARKVKKKKRSNNTLKRWRTTKRKIRLFLKYKFKKWDIPLSEIKYCHAEDFFNFLTLDEGLEDNTTSKYLKNTKELLKIAYDREWVTRNPWASYKIHYDQPERQIIDLLDIYNLYKKSLIDRLDHVRNVFLFACFTGYSFQEILNLTPDDVYTDIHGKRWIKIDRQKTRNPEYIQLLPIPASIIDRYNDDTYCKAQNKLLPIKSYTHYNGYLKEVGYICGFKIELSTHVARHTFATTICLDHGVSLETLQRLLGHDSIRSTQIYGKITKKRIRTEMNELEKQLFNEDGKIAFTPIVEIMIQNQLRVNAF